MAELRVKHFYRFRQPKMPLVVWGLRIALAKWLSVLASWLHGADFVEIHQEYYASDSSGTLIEKIGEDHAEGHL